MLSHTQLHITERIDLAQQNCGKLILELRKEAEEPEGKKKKRKLGNPRPPLVGGMEEVKTFSKIHWGRGKRKI